MVPLNRVLLDLLMPLPHLNRLHLVRYLTLPRSVSYTHLDVYKRQAPGYPSCPEHTEKALIWDLLEVEQRIGMKLTESYAMWPAASVCGWYFTHPASNYFTLGRIDEDQAQDYAKRKGWDEREMMKWLGVAMK